MFNPIWRVLKHRGELFGLSAPMERGYAACARHENSVEVAYGVG